MLVSVLEVEAFVLALKSNLIIKVLNGSYRVHFSLENTGKWKYVASSLSLGGQKPLHQIYDCNELSNKQRTIRGAPLQ